MSVFYVSCFALARGIGGQFRGQLAAPGVDCVIHRTQNAHPLICGPLVIILYCTMHHHHAVGARGFLCYFAPRSFVGGAFPFNFILALEVATAPAWGGDLGGREFASSSAEISVHLRPCSAFACLSKLNPILF
jgi:hypothetical protein